MEKIIIGKQALAKYNELKEKGLIILECVVGSQAYGTALPTSDIDKKFVYIEPIEEILKGTQTDQINISDDYVGYEIRRFVELLSTGNPNILDLVNPPFDTIITCHEFYRHFFINQKEKFLSKKCYYSFGKYAESQIKKARGTNKKIVNPMPKERKGLSDFIWVAKGTGSIALKDYLEEKGIKLKWCGISAIDHMKNTYNLFVDPIIEKERNKFIIEAIDELNFIEKNIFCFFINLDSYIVKYKPKIYKNMIEKYASWLTKMDEINVWKYKGIIDKDDVQPVFDSIEKGQNPLCQVYVNIEGFQNFCQQHREYWEWVEKRNEVRYQNNMDNGAAYDTKNMMHCHRLLDMCIEIFKERKINVRRDNREQLLEIRAGKYSYDNLIEDANKKVSEIETLSKSSELPENVSVDFLNEMLLQLRVNFYETVK